jgi:ATP-binding cassette, subfamily C, type I secretion system permease/ATPase
MEVFTRKPTGAIVAGAGTRLGLAQAGGRNAAALRAMAMTERLSTRWGAINAGYMDSQQRVADIAGGLGALSWILRMLMQSAVLGIGAWLVIEQQATAGAIIAASILTARALAPVELAIAHGRGFLAARQSWTRLSRVLAGVARSEKLPLPPPRLDLVVENLAVAPPGEQKLVAHEADFCHEAGHAVSILGPSAAGKSSLARVLVGVWRPARGKVRFDGAALDQWSPALLGRHVGYLPQDIELFGGTVAENIARFDVNAESAAIIAAAQAAGVHDMIMPLPDGYETLIGGRGRRSPPASASASHWRARCTATRFSSCSTSRIRTSTLRASRR